MQVKEGILATLQWQLDIKGTLSPAAPSTGRRQNTRNTLNGSRRSTLRRSVVPADGESQQCLGFQVLLQSLP